MAQKDPTAKSLPPGMSRVDEIDRRAEALRENLKKRKAQMKNKVKNEIQE